MGGITQSLHITARTYAYDLDDKNGNHPSQQKGKSNRLIKSCIMGIIYIYISYILYAYMIYEKSVVFLEETNVLNRTPESVAPTESQPKFWWGKNHGDPLAQVNMMNWILQFPRQISHQWFWRKYQDVWPMGCQWVMLSLNLSESFWICWELGFVMFFWKWGTCFLMVTLHISLMAIAEEYTPF